VRTRLEGEGDEKTIVLAAEALEKTISDRRSQLNRAAQTIVAKDNDLEQLDKEKEKLQLAYNRTKQRMRQIGGTSPKCQNQSWSTKGGYGPPGPPGPPCSTLVHIFGKISKSVDQNGSEWTRWTIGTTTPLGGPAAFRTTLDHAPTFS